MTDKTASATNIIPFPGPAERERRRLMAHLFNRPVDRADMIARALGRQAGREPMGMFAGVAK